MKKTYDTVLDGSNNSRPVVGAIIRVLEYPSGVEATIYSANSAVPGNVIAELSTNSKGYFEFYATDGRYTIETYYGGVLKDTIQDILIEDPVDASEVDMDGGTITNSDFQTGTIRSDVTIEQLDALDLSVNVDTAAEATAYIGAKEGETISILTGSKKGLWRATLLDIQTEVTADPGGLEYLPWDSDASGADGGLRKISDFSLLLDTATDEDTANTLVLRDADGRAEFADPASAQQAATKNYVDNKEFGTANYGDATVTGAKIAADTIEKSNMADDSVGLNELDDSEVYADQSEAEAGTESTKIMTAQRVRQAIEASAAGVVVLDSHTVTPTEQFINFPTVFSDNTGYKFFRIVLEDLESSSGGNLTIQVSTDGSTYQTGATAYDTLREFFDPAAVGVTETSNAGLSAMQPIAAAFTGGGIVSGKIDVSDPNRAEKVPFVSRIDRTGVGTNRGVHAIAVGQYGTATALTGFRLAATNMIAGTVTVLGSNYPF